MLLTPKSKSLTQHVLVQVESFDMSNYCIAYSHGLNTVCDPFFIKHTHMYILKHTHT